MATLARTAAAAEVNPPPAELPAVTSPGVQSELDARMRALHRALHERGSIVEFLSPDGILVRYSAVDRCSGTQSGERASVPPAAVDAGVDLPVRSDGKGWMDPADCERTGARAEVMRLDLRSIAAALATPWPETIEQPGSSHPVLVLADEGSRVLSFRWARKNGRWVIIAIEYTQEDPG